MGHDTSVNNCLYMFLSDKGPMLETLDYTIRIGSTPTFLYFDLFIYRYIIRYFLHQFTLHKLSSLITIVNIPNINLRISSFEVI